tara:strand:- start:75256 stop:76665 length:1410 start_codon:yes stop_codon:yes gene_type:complete
MSPHKFAAIAAFCFVLALPLLLVGASSSDYVLYLSLTFALSAIPFIGKSIMNITLIFGGVIICNFLVLGQNIYIEQLTSFFDAPGDAMSMTTELITWYTPVLALGYIVVSVFLYQRIESERLLKGVRMLSMPFALIYLALPVLGFIDGIPAYSPLQHIYNYATGAKASNVVIGDIAEPVYLSDGDRHKKIVLVIGESQTSFNESGVDETIAPFIHSLELDRKGVILNNVVQSGLFTLVSHTQILEGASIQDIHKPHVALYGAAKSNANPWMISSRSWEWGRLSESMYGFNSYDCSDIIDDCSFIGSADDMLMLKEKIIPLLDEEEYFIVWQMNGSHTPLHDKYTPEFEVSSSEYLSSVKYTDHVMRELFENIDNDTWVIFMSDHSAERDGSKYKVAAFIANKGFDFKRYGWLRDSKLTHFDLLGTVYNLHGVEYTNGEYYNVLTDEIPNERSRRTYDFLRTENFRIIND